MKLKYLFFASIAYGIIASTCALYSIEKSALSQLANAPFVQKIKRSYSSLYTALGERAPALCASTAGIILFGAQLLTCQEDELESTSFLSCAAKGIFGYACARTAQLIGTSLARHGMWGRPRIPLMEIAYTGDEEKLNTVLAYGEPYNINFGAAWGIPSLDFNPASVWNAPADASEMKEFCEDKDPFIVAIQRHHLSIARQFLSIPQIVRILSAEDYRTKKSIFCSLVLPRHADIAYREKSNELARDYDSVCFSSEERERLTKELVMLQKSQEK